jgi:DNA-binding NarL/FixJ family response regulator
VPTPRHPAEWTFTATEMRVASLFADGRLIREVAGKLGVPDDTVKTHTRKMMRRTGARNKTQLIALMIRYGYLPTGGEHIDINHNRCSQMCFWTQTSKGRYQK